MKLLCLFASLLLLAPALYAKGGPCKADREKFCKTVEKGEGRINRCLFKNWGTVSPTCKTDRQFGFDKWNKRQESCGVDIKNFCGAVAQGKGAIRKCLKTNEAKLTSSCTTFITGKKSEHKQKLAACKADIDQHCTGITKGGGATWKCLVENQAALSEGCKTQWPSLGHRAARKAKRAERKAGKAERRAERMKKKALRKGANVEAPAAKSEAYDKAHGQDSEHPHSH